MTICLNFNESADLPKWCDHASNTKPATLDKKSIYINILREFFTHFWIDFTVREFTQELIFSKSALGLIGLER